MISPIVKKLPNPPIKAGKTIKSIFNTADDHSKVQIAVCKTEYMCGLEISLLILAYIGKLVKGLTPHPKEQTRTTFYV